ncbi:MAG: NAD-dependent DNA ligase LigA [Porphyromonas sp.]|nr:NAD-dependent DNA ligase LigA [Porphyromonas sp.]
MKERIEQLREELNNHNYNYYVLGVPTISDFEFDALMKELEALEAKHPEFFDPLSPTQRVGSDLTEKGVKVKHTRPMLSLSNSYSFEDVISFVSRVKETIREDKIEYNVELKLDGISISIIYENGRLIQALTRGDGEQGEDVTASIKAIPSIPLKLRGANTIPGRIEVRGEIILPWKRFEEINEERAKSGEELFANPRNAVSGTIKQYSPALVAYRRPEAYIYYIYTDDISLLPKTISERIKLLQTLGFKTESHGRVCSSVDDILEFIKHWESKRDDLPFATDGIVIKVNEIGQQEELGLTAKSPRWAIAYKYPAERKESKLIGVEFQVGRTGTVTPVGVMDPLHLSGTIVRRASLHNADYIKSMDLRIGDIVEVEKGGEIIPKIVKVRTDLRKEEDTFPIVFPSNCPECGTPLVRKEDVAAICCPNSTECPPQIINSIEHFCSRKALNINIGPETIKELYRKEMVKDVADLYTLTPMHFIQLKGFKERSALKLYDSIKGSLATPYNRVLYALGIPQIGETTAKLLAQKFKSIDNLSMQTTEALCEVEGIGEVVANSIKDYFQEERHITLIRRLKESGLKLEEDSSEQKVISEKLEGMTFVVSGTFSSHSRDEIKELITQNGGKVASSISSKTSKVIAGENMGPQKLEKANKLNIPIISEEDFLNLID